MSWLVPLTAVSIDDHEIEATRRVLESGWLSMGHEVQAFEEEFAKAINTTHAIATANATDALALCYDAVGVEGGQSIAMCGLTFVASLNVALRRGENPVLIDIVGEDDLTMCPEDLERKISEDMRLIVTMPYGGFSPDMDAIMEIAHKKRIPIIEDACHGILGAYKGQMLGSLGSAGVFSFYSNKNMTTGEGGMITTNDDAIAGRVQLMRNHGMTRSTTDHYLKGVSDYDVVIAGHNFRMDEIRGSIGREQLKKLPDLNYKRAEKAQKIKAAILAKHPSVKFPFSKHDHEDSSHHLLVMLLPEDVPRDHFIAKMTNHSVQTSIHYKPLHRFAHTSGLFDHNFKLPKLERVEKRLVTLPLFPQITDEQIEILADAVVSSLNV